MCGQPLEDDEQFVKFRMPPEIPNEARAEVVAAIAADLMVAAKLYEARAKE